MTINNISAEQLISEAVISGASFLDLGNCGLTDHSPELKILAAAKAPVSLNLGTEYFDNETKLVASANKGTPNYFTSIPILYPHLRYLQIRNAGIKTITNTSLLSQLRLLDLSINNIDKMENLEPLQNLEELALHANSIYEIGQLPLKTLKILHLTNNKISRIANLENLQNLEQLLLSANAIRKIEGLGRLQKLVLLDLNTNLIEKIENLETLTQLKTLWLYKNELTKIEGLETLSELDYIDLSNNHIQSIENIGQLGKLKSFFINNNHIKKIEPLTHLSGLQYFSLKSNFVDDCPSDVWQSGDIRQVRAYFEKDIREEKTTMANSPEPEHTDAITKDVKLILLGNSNTGKTNLVHYLEKGLFLKERNSTHGLEVQRWKPDPKRFPLLKDIQVSIWDFGGQEYYHDAYKLFLTANAVYIILWEKDIDNNFQKSTFIDAVKEEMLEHFEKRYWLDTVRYYGSKREFAPLLLVQNKTDSQEKDKRRISQELYNEYELYECFHISLKEGTNPENKQQCMILQLFEKELESVLLKAADNAEIPPSWQLIRKMIIEWQDKPATQHNLLDPYIRDEVWMNINDFNNACRGLTPTALSENDLYTLPRWLDKTCAIIYFENNEHLRDKVFMSPKKLSEKIYQVLNKNILIRKGEFSAEDIDGTPEFKETFIEVTKDLGLLFDHPLKKDFYIAPQYLPTEHAIEDLFRIASSNAWQDGFWVKVPLFYYKRLLNHLILTYVGGEGVSARYFWKHGIVFIKGGLRVMIKGLYPEKMQSEGIILVGVEDGVPRNEILREVFNHIFNYEKKVNPTEVLKEKAILESTASLSRSVDTRVAPEGKFLKNLQLSYDSVNYEFYDRLLALSEQKDPFFNAKDSNARLSLYKFATILPFTVNSRPPKKIFVSYSHQNTAWLNKLRVHLSGLKHGNLIEDWTDQEILAGEKWDRKIKDNMKDADVFICLLSANFIASEYIWNIELKAVFDKIKSRNAQVIFIYVEPFDLGSLSGSNISDDMKTASILDFEIIPKNTDGHLIALSLWGNENQGLATIVKKIREAIER